MPGSNHTQDNYQVLLNKAMQQNVLFNQLELPVYNALKDALDFVWLKAGEVVMKQGAPSNSLAIVLLGRVRVERHVNDGSKQTLLHLGHGQTIGEIGLLTDEPRTADVVAIRDTLLATLSRNAYHSLLKTHPVEMNQHFTRPIFGRLQSQLQGVTRVNTSTLTMVWLPAHPSFTFDALLAQLIPQLHRAASVLVVDSQLVKDRYGTVDSDSPDADQQLARWLGEQETYYDAIIYIADNDDIQWQRRCLRQADKIVLFGDATVEAPINDAEISALQLPEAADLDRYLVLVQPEEIDLPEGSLYWINAIQCRHHYHLKLSDDHTIARVARLLVGRGIGLVLCGASARGSAHLGVYQAFMDAGITVDVIAGASSGAVSAVGIAIGWGMDELLHRSEPRLKLQLTLPFSALTTGYGISRWYDDTFGNRQIEDCWQPTFCPIYNLTHGRLEIRETGPISYLLRIATALPGLFPPVLEGTDILVDAGVVNYMPINIMYDRPDIGTIIAIEMRTFDAQKARKSFAYDGRISGWRIFWNKLNPFAKKLRYMSIMGVLFPSILAAGVQLDRETIHLADYRLEIDLSDFGPADTSRTSELISTGYREVSQQIRELNLAEKMDQLLTSPSDRIRETK